MSRRVMRAACSALLAAGLLVGPALAGTTGKLSGRVTNDKKEPLPGVNIRIEGQRLGAFSDDQGNYVIVAVPAGTYEVKANLLGHAPYSVVGVQINPDFTTTQDIVLKTEAIEQEEVRVEATRPLLQKDATGTTRFISSEDIQKLPTRGYRDAAAQQTGVVNFQRNIDNEAQNAPTLIIRGGRPNETAYYVDGFSQQDALTGTSSTSISNNAIEEVVVMTGGFSPEYGRIMSGAVNVITREGSSKYFGSVEAVSDVLAGEWINAPHTDYNLYDVSLGGPVIPGGDRLTFYVSGERRWQRDRQPTFMPAQYNSALDGLGLDTDLKPQNGSSGYTLQGKVNWRVADQTTVKAGGLGSHDEWAQYSHAYLYNLPHSPRYEDFNQNYYGTVNHVFNTRNFGNVGFNYFETQRKRGDGVAFDRLDQYGRVNNPRYDTDLPIFWDSGHVFDDYLQRQSSYWGVQASYTSQMNQYHQLKFGGDFQRHTLRYFDHYFPTELQGDQPNLDDYDSYGYDLNTSYRPEVVFEDDTVAVDTIMVLDRAWLSENGDGARDGPKHPKVFSLFAQDKFEREGVIVNGGLRYDYINVDTEALKSESFPLGDPEGALNDTLDSADLQENKTYARISPRVGVAFPVDEKTVLRFNYGQFYQQPNLQDLYVSYRFLEHKIQTGGYFVGFGNPNLRPERTTAYEVGVARQVGDNARIDITAYYKDVKDLVEITNIQSFPNSFSSYRNRDFATIKGIDLGYTMRPVQHISGNVAYSLSFAQGTGSVSQTQRNVAWTASQPPKQTAPLDFDQRHKVSFNVDYRMGRGEQPGWDRWKILDDFGVNVLLNLASGTPYTPTTVYNEVTLAAVSSQPSGPLNSRYGPWTSSLDLKMSKGFGFGGLDFEAFLWTLNAFNTRNPVTVYTSTGSPDATSWLQTEDGQTFLQSTADRNGEALYQTAENNPNLYSSPRLVRFGLRANF